MNRILLIGNGFDLAHGLMTKYDDFLFLIRNWDLMRLIHKEMVYNKRNADYIFEYCLANYGIFKEFVWNKYLNILPRIKENELLFIEKLIYNNAWLEYYRECGAEIDGWIDFEKEIYPVIELFEFIFNSNYSIYKMDNANNVEAIIDIKEFRPNLIRIVKLWNKFFYIRDQYVVIKTSFVSKQYGILKKKIIETLRQELELFISAFEIYLIKFANPYENNFLLKQIKDINATYVISFNYTRTEALYNISDKNVHHIHGRVRDDFSRKNNMVLGVSEQKSNNIDFIYFVKYFQRIQKKSGVKYKDFIKQFEKSTNDLHYMEDYILYIYGHSLDETDEDILKFVIGDINDEKGVGFKPKQVIIFYYDSKDFEQKVINLIKLYGRAVVEKYMEMENFKFIPTSQDIYMRET